MLACILITLAELKICGTCGAYFRYWLALPHLQKFTVVNFYKFVNIEIVTWYQSTQKH